MRHEILRQHDTLSISISSLLLRADRAARLMFFSLPQTSMSKVDVVKFLSIFYFFQGFLLIFTLHFILVLSDTFWQLQIVVQIIKFVAPQVQLRFKNKRVYLCQCMFVFLLTLFSVVVIGFCVNKTQKFLTVITPVFSVSTSGAQFTFNYRQVFIMNTLNK